MCDVSFVTCVHCVIDQYENSVYDCPPPRQTAPALNNINGAASSNLQLINNLNKDKLNKNVEADKLGAATSCSGGVDHRRAGVAGGASSSSSGAAGNNVNMNIKGMGIIVLNILKFST